MKLKQYSLFFNNPEFTRNLWVNFSFIGLGLTMFLMGNILIFAHYNASNFSTLLNIYLFAFICIVGFWGSQNVINSFLQEFKQGTWDYQRLSTNTPIQMILGKLLGASMMQWILGILLFITMLFHFQTIPKPANVWLKISQYILLLSIIIIILQCHVLINFLLLWRKGSKKATRKMQSSSLAFIVLIIILFATPWGDDSFWRNSTMNNMTLFGIHLTTLQYTLIILSFLMAWSFIGLYNLFRSEFGHKVSPLWWAGFLLSIYIIAYSTAFITPFNRFLEGSAISFFTTISIITAVSIYIMLYYANKDASVWVRLGRYWQYGARQKIFYSIPNWFISYLLTIILAIISSIFIFQEISPDGDFFYALSIILSFLLFITRDILLVLYFNLSRQSGYLIMVFLLLYLSYPLNIRFLPSGLFFPSFDHHYGSLILAIASPLVQIIIVLLLFKINWQKYIPSFKE